MKKLLVLISLSLLVTSCGSSNKKSETDALKVGLTGEYFHPLTVEGICDNGVRLPEASNMLFNCQQTLELKKDGSGSLMLTDIMSQITYSLLDNKLEIEATELLDDKLTLTVQADGSLKDEDGSIWYIQDQISSVISQVQDVEESFKELTQCGDYTISQKSFIYTIDKEEVTREIISANKEDNSQDFVQIVKGHLEARFSEVTLSLKINENQEYTYSIDGETFQDCEGME